MHVNFKCPLDCCKNYLETWKSVAWAVSRRVFTMRLARKTEWTRWADLALMRATPSTGWTTWDIMSVSGLQHLACGSLAGTDTFILKLGVTPPTSQALYPRSLACRHPILGLSCHNPVGSFLLAISIHIPYQFCISMQPDSHILSMSHSKHKTKILPEVYTPHPCHSNSSGK